VGCRTSGGTRARSSFFRWTDVSRRRSMTTRARCSRYRGRSVFASSATIGSGVIAWRAKPPRGGTRSRRSRPSWAIDRRKACTAMRTWAARHSSVWWRTWGRHHRLTSTSGQRQAGVSMTERRNTPQSCVNLATPNGAGGGTRTRRGPFLRSRRTLTTLVVYERYPGASRMATSTLRHIFSLHCRSPRPPDVPTLARVPNGIGGRS